jgi:hypothetical protein
VGRPGLAVEPRAVGPTSTLPTVALATWALAVTAFALIAFVVRFAPGGATVAHALLGTKPSAVPHSTSRGTLGYALGLLVNNVIVALWPLSGLYLLRDCPRPWRRVFIAIVVAAAVRSVAPVAVATGVWGSRLLPYIPNAPFELAAITTGGVLYVLRSDRRISAIALRSGVAAVLLLLLIAAVLETWAVPSQ